MSADATYEAFRNVTSHDSKLDNVWVTPYHADEKKKADQHQFVFFLKPEATAAHAGVDVKSVIARTFALLAHHHIHIGAVRVLSGDYLRKHDIMVQHYGVISKVYKSGVDVITEEAKKRLHELYQNKIDAGATVISGGQLLQLYPDLNPFSLLVLNDNLGTTRLAGGTYAMDLNVQGKKYIVLNAFHGYQLVPFTTTGRAIIVFEGLSQAPWKSLRDNVCGTTDPNTAAAGSVRQVFLSEKKTYGFVSVDKSSNGCHMSAGPLEALVEVTRFFGNGGENLNVNQTNFGHLLAHEGLSADRINALASNIKVTSGGKSITSFDLTEEVNGKDAAQALKAAQ